MEVIVVATRLGQVVGGSALEMLEVLPLVLLPTSIYEVLLKWWALLISIA